jgi:GH15 family glucan-1,4-alpha-glucosidase
LVAKTGAIDFLSLPALHSPTVFGALLDPGKGGSFELTPVEPFEVERSYLGRTNVLQTTFRTAAGAVRVTDALCLQEGAPLPWIELARGIEGLAGEVRLRWRVAPRFDWGRQAPRIERRGGALVAEEGELRLGVHAWDAGEPVPDDESISASFVVHSGARALLALCCSHRQPIPIPERSEVEHRLEQTPGIWRRWLETSGYGGGWADAVFRSALLLKLLVYAPTGAIAAAPTSSLPERIGGDKNYDYRYAWVRDSAFTLDAMMRLGLSAQVHESFSFLLGAVRETAPDLHPLYSLEGGTPQRAEELSLRGYQDSRPVRYGNAARDQLQLGCWGDLVETADLYVEHGNALDDGSARMIADCLDRLCVIWQDEDSGIWELDEHRHWTSSKLAVWMAFDRALGLVERGQLPARHADRWRIERDRVRTFVEERCWSSRLGAYGAHADTDELVDAAVLRGARMGWSRVAPQRFARTIDVVRTRLAAGGPLLYRTTGHVGEEGAFVACSFWLAEALAGTGRVDEARVLMHELVALANDVGLLPEQIDPSSHAFLGNFPQGLSHLALINAAGAIESRGA